MKVHLQLDSTQLVPTIIADQVFQRIVTLLFGQHIYLKEKASNKGN